MNRTILAIISANLVVLVTLVFVYPHLMVSPGALVADHAELTSDCSACHSPFRGAASERCLTCHVPDDIGMRTTKGVSLPNRSVKASFHQQLIEHDCMACHSDHEGPKLTGHSRKPFSHALLRPAIRESCETCHTSPNDSLHRKITGNCGQCHGQEGWQPATFDHDERFLLDRDHSASCVTCHTDDDYSVYTCYGCHAHTPAGIRAEHVEEGIRNFENCVDCHRSASGEPEGQGQDRD